jgi:hypothetical protein
MAFPPPHYNCELHAISTKIYIIPLNTIGCKFNALGKYWRIKGKYGYENNLQCHKIRTVMAGFKQLPF